jgi:AraC family transcriptional regulator of adaptative response/methylated-DNA-[protein]-cysteine methyltransferase
LIAALDREEKLTGEKLRAMKIDPSTARRQFQQHCGMSFAAYQRARKMGTAIEEISSGKRVIDAQQSAGFESPSGFREAFAKHFGVSAKDAANVQTLQMKWLTSPLGPILAIAGEKGIVLCDFMDRRSIESAIARLRKRFEMNEHPATISPGENRHLEKLERELKEYFAGRLKNFTVPVAPAGTGFEQRAWEYLKTIPYAETRSYGQQAKALKAPGASRAVGRANGMNYIAIVIPCHRVIGADGKLTGYGGGVARKKWLLDHEQRFAGKGSLFDRAE